MGFQTNSGNVGWFKIATDFLGNLVVSHGQFGTQGETLTIGQKSILMGDVNCDGAVNLLDVGPFIGLIVQEAFLDKADFDQNGVVNLLDVGPFIDALIGS